MQLELPTDIFTYPDISLPEVWTVSQQMRNPALASNELEQAATRAAAELCLGAHLGAGARVAVGCGSRGLSNLVPVVRAVVTELRRRGLKPFIVPAMGSHGGATADGQRSVLLEYGLTPAEIGAEIEATMDTEIIGCLSGDSAGEFAGHPVHIDRIAAAADAIILINRIKPHTDFTGPIESGIGKMCAIGLGKRLGADGIHRFGAHGLRELMPRVARYMVEHASIIGGVALLENELGQTAEIHAVPAGSIACAGETALLGRAREMTPQIPFDEIDVLVIDEIGKNISGTGMDTHCIGRTLMPSIPEESWGGPRVRIVVALDICAASHGNASGLGLADITTRQLVEKVDFAATFTNTRTSGEGGVLKSRLPLICETALDAVRTAIGSCGRGSVDAVRLVRIRSTADTQKLEVTAPLLDQARTAPGLSVTGGSSALDVEHPLKPGVRG